MYRSMHCVLYDSPEFVVLSTNAKLVLHLLKLTREAHATGIYPLHRSILLERNPGWRPRDVDAALAELEREDWIRIRDGLVWVRNALKYEPNYDLSQREKMLGVANHLMSLPRSSLIRDFCAYYGIPVPPGTPEQVRQDSLPGLATVPGPAGGPGGARVGPARGSAGEGEGTGEGSGTGHNTRVRAVPHPADEGFEEFWLEYPRKTKKAEARAVWRRLRPSAALRDRIMGAVRMQAAWPQWAKTDEDGVHRWIPHASTWLRGERWEDQAPPTDPRGGQPVSDVERRWREGRK